MSETYRQVRPYLRLAISLFMYYRLDVNLRGVGKGGFEGVMECARARADECLGHLDLDLAKEPK